LEILAPPGTGHAVPFRRRSSYIGLKQRRRRTLPIKTRPCPIRHRVPDCRSTAALWYRQPSRVPRLGSVRSRRGTHRRSFDIIQISQVLDLRGHNDLAHRGGLHDIFLPCLPKVAGPSSTIGHVPRQLDELRSEPGNPDACYTTRLTIGHADREEPGCRRNTPNTNMASRYPD
jgi:hypothetical protein